MRFSSRYQVKEENPAAALHHRTAQLSRLAQAEVDASPAPSCAAVRLPENRCWEAIATFMPFTRRVLFNYHVNQQISARKNNVSWLKHRNNKFSYILLLPKKSVCMGTLQFPSCIFFHKMGIIVYYSSGMLTKHFIDIYNIPLEDSKVSNKN